MDSPDVEVKINGRPALTIEQLAELGGITVAAAYKLVSRAKLTPAGRIGNVYDEADARLALNRPGKGNPGVPRPHVPPAERAAKTARTGMGDRLRSKAQKKT